LQVKTQKKQRKVQECGLLHRMQNMPKKVYWGNWPAVFEKKVPAQARCEKQSGNKWYFPAL
jgi:hypothetical protein